MQGRDITERRRLLEERARREKLESVGTLAGGIAHDFNNILGAILANISLARAEMPASHEVQRWLHDGESAVFRARDLTKQLLTFTSGGVPVKKLTALRELTLTVVTLATRGTSVRCEFAIAGDLWSAEVDEGQISQVISNIAINARQAMPEGGVIDVEADNLVLKQDGSLGTRLPLPSGEYVRISVRDHGMGIKAEDISRIFDPYFTTKPDGTGLGLATSHSIVRQHGGHIGVESVPGRGTVFHVYLPACPGASAPPGSRGADESCSFSGRALVMDDEDGLREMISRMLLRIGFTHVAMTSNGQEAVKVYDEALKSGRRFNVAILDLTVPGDMGGREAMRKLRELDPNVVAIISSGYAGEPIMGNYQGYGFKGVLAKPYTLDDLTHTLRKVLGGQSNA